jgi:hypothetical protein
MDLLRRFFLILFVLVGPPFVTALCYFGSKYMLRATHRVIAPEVLWYAAVVELAIFFFVAVLEVRGRWTIQA